MPCYFLAWTGKPSQSLALSNRKELVCGGEHGKVKLIWQNVWGGEVGKEVKFITILIFSHAFANKA